MTDRVFHLKKSFSLNYSAFRKGTPPPLRLQFYPYRGLSHTLRVREGVVHLRISDVLTSAPLEVLEAVLGILVYRLFCRKAPSELLQLYSTYIRQPDVQQQLWELRRQRARKFLTGSRGHTYDLAKIFDEVNRKHFGSSVQVSCLSWSRRGSRTVLGHYDDAQGAIVINRLLDRPGVPPIVIEYVLFHEMLHSLMGEKVQNGRRCVHHKSFRDAERRFPGRLGALRLARLCLAQAGARFTL
ncbi:MAG: hypothetical protein HY645_06025 [Acidobacteria bacterium]|nr:hypothetical protein [Acidobacteriota bacterium]